MERLVVIPEVFDAQKELYLIDTNTFHEWAEQRLTHRSRNLLDVAGVMDRPDAESIPNPQHARIRQLVVNVMVFELPDDIYDDIQKSNHPNHLMTVVSNAQLLGTMKLPQSGESRLVGKLASGLGGHVDESDWLKEDRTIDDVLRRAMVRELCDEELSTDNYQAFCDYVEYRTEPLAVLNSNFGEVESVHIGFVSVLALPKRANVRVHEVEKLETIWVPLVGFKNELQMFWEQRDGHKKLDRWTQLLFGRIELNWFMKKLVASIQ